MSWLFALTVVGYATASTLLFVVAWQAPSDKDKTGSRMIHAAVATFLLGFAAQTADIGLACVHGLHPFGTARDAVGAVAWFLAGVYLLLWTRLRLPTVGSLLVPLILVLYTLARLAPSQETPRAGTPLGTVHILSAPVGLALFAIAAGSAIVYLWSERRLKSHRKNLAAGASLESLDKLNRRAIAVGFPTFSVAIVSGAMWWTQLAEPSRHLPQFLLSGAAWVLFAALVVMRLAIGFRGRRAAQVTVAGFATALGALLVYLVRGAAG